MKITETSRQLSKIFSGSTLKLIAIFSMVCDHIGAAFLIFYLQKLPVTESNLIQIQNLQAVYQILRHIGRLAFPIFCFLLVEGFLHTRNVKKYAARLALFCLLSEIPFDLAFSHKLFDPVYQNVFFTLFIGFLVLWAIQSANRLPFGPAQMFVPCAATIVGCFFAEFLHTDYGAAGVLAILLFYLLHQTPFLAVLAACGLLTLHNPKEVYTFFTVLLLPFYNGKRGLNLKYIFYIIYPLHLFLLFLLCQIFCGSNA
ncbi:MAG: TraX family protein [Lachnospiraceae bacterium]